jgi:pyruvate,water dikinase
VTELSRTLAELRAKDEQHFGGKSASLGELTAGEIPVPAGFAVSTAAFEAFLALDGLGERVAARLHGLDPEDVAAAAAASAEVALEMRRTAVPEAVADEVARHYGALAAASGKRQPPVAVRSSARGEDSAEATFAGQQETYLWVRGTDGVCEAIRGCWISLYSAPAIAYRAQMAAADAAAPAMGVAVQSMVDAEVSGVMFTCSPLTGDPSVVAINASWGLGLGVVGGEVTPDDFLISKVSHELLRSTIADKQVEYVPDPGGRGTHRVKVDDARRTAPCLDEERLHALVETARLIERHFGSRQDVEWAIARTGSFPENLYVLQSRPVTATAKAGSEAVADRAGLDTMSLVLGTFGVPPQRG